MHDVVVLVLSYIIDWIFIVGIALIGYAFYTVTPNHIPFSLTDARISFPYDEHDTVSTGVLVVVALVAPAVIIGFVSLVLFPGSVVSKATPRSVLWTHKVWEWNAGWMGLGLAVTGAFMATQGLKALYGKPRPDMLARCDPDLSNIAAHAVSGLGRRLSGAPTMVTWEICQNKSDTLKVDGFSSFPSGHASFSFAGLTYLSLWLCSKFSIAFPYLPHYPFASVPPGRKYEISAEELNGNVDSKKDKAMSIPHHAAAPPVYMVIMAFVPFAVAHFIAASRWFDYRHHGFDIIFGSVMGIVFAWTSFQLYHLPIGRGAGWSWGARSRHHAFFKGIGLPSHIGYHNWTASRVRHSTGTDIRLQEMDIESAPGASTG